MDTKIRIVLFCVWMVILVLWELYSPKIDKSARRAERWKCNILIILSGQLMVRLLLFLGLFKLVDYTHSVQWGLFYFLKVSELSLPIQTFLHLFVLDFLIYLQHLLSHRIPLLWRLHRVHHMEDFLDVTSALRFHPFEIAFSLIYKAFWLAFLGISMESFLIFEILLSSMAMFNHANIRLGPVDRFLRKLLVTPDFHRIHHYAHRDYMHTNFGFNLSWWDYLFRTYKNDDECPLSVDEMGIEEKPKRLHQFLWLLGSPKESI